MAGGASPVLMLWPSPPAWAKPSGPSPQPKPQPAEGSHERENWNLNPKPSSPKRNLEPEIKHILILRIEETRDSGSSGESASYERKGLGFRVWGVEGRLLRDLGKAEEWNTCA